MNYLMNSEKLNHLDIILPQCFLNFLSFRQGEVKFLLLDVQIYQQVAHLQIDISFIFQ